MADSKIRHRYPIIAMESLAMGAAAEDIAAAGGTIPQNTGEIMFFVPSGDNVHWHPTGTPTSTFGHAVKASSVGLLTHAQRLAKIISDDGSDVALLIAYMRGGGRSDAAYSLSAPY